jgi:hypothetical protein
MTKKPRASKPKKLLPIDDKAVIRRVLDATEVEVDRAEAEAKAKGKRFKRVLKYAIVFAKHMGDEIVRILDPYFPGVVSGEKPSRGVRGMNRVDVQYSTREAGLELALSFKSVHFGERAGGDARFIHNRKRNDEELRVEATGHHLRQPYAVMVAVVFLPFESCDDMPKTSSFASWVEYLWPLKGRVEPDDAPDLFELAFIGLYARDRSEMRFYEVGGKVPCPRKGRPATLLTIDEFVELIRAVYTKRNRRDFFFAGEGPGGSDLL